MLVAITVLAILSTLVCITLGNMKQAAEASKAAADAGTLNTALGTALAQGLVTVSGAQVRLTFADKTTQFAVDAPVATMAETQALLAQLGLPASGYVGVSPNNYQGYSSVIWLTASASGSGLVTFVSGTTDQFVTSGSFYGFVPNAGSVDIALATTTGGKREYDILSTGGLPMGPTPTGGGITPTPTSVTPTPTPTEVPTPTPTPALSPLTLSVSPVPLTLTSISSGTLTATVGGLGATETVTTWNWHNVSVYHYSVTGAGRTAAAKGLTSTYRSATYSSNLTITTSLGRTATAAYSLQFAPVVSPTVSISANPLNISSAGSYTLTANMAGLDPGETVTKWTWPSTSTGSSSISASSAQTTSVSANYPGSGWWTGNVTGSMTSSVSITTSLGATASATGVVNVNLAQPVAMGGSGYPQYYHLQTEISNSFTDGELVAWFSDGQTVNVGQNGFVSSNLTGGLNDGTEVWPPSFSTSGGGGAALPVGTWQGGDIPAVAGVSNSHPSISFTVNLTRAITNINNQFEGNPGAVIKATVSGLGYGTAEIYSPGVTIQNIGFGETPRDYVWKFDSSGVAYDTQVSQHEVSISLGLVSYFFETQEVNGNVGPFVSGTSNSTVTIYWPANTPSGTLKRVDLTVKLNDGKTISQALFLRTP
jgi:hypothetical protein